ncbi:MAG TPA: hypothetical protein VIM69_03690 [Opitutaceae bacterium]
MSITTIWTHGNALTVEDPRDTAYLWHRGWGSELTFPGPRDNESSSQATRYCHLAIPTPRTLNGEPMELTKLIVLFEVQGDMRISRIDVWDANIPVAQFNEDRNPGGQIKGVGSHLTIDSTNQLSLPRPYPVQYGIGVSFVCELSFWDGQEPLVLTLAAVGAEFISPIHIPPIPIHR